MRVSLCHESGGLIYHLRALRYRKTLWHPFVEQVGKCLASWQPPQQDLLIVGPSAGYTLSAPFLARFRRIDILEPDPLARWILSRRFPDRSFHTGGLDCFKTEDGARRLREAYPQHAILFSNVIGQMPDESGAWKRNMVEALRSTSWASYHDLVSTSRKPARIDSVVLPAGTSLEDVLGHFWQGGELEIRDHETCGLVPAETAYVPWSITPDQHHLVAWNCITVV